ncbi:MAG TPA: serine protease [Caulobacteraceae bacterium]|jgi:hypothetical protein
MSGLRRPGWLVYPLLLALLLVTALGRREHADAPPPPPPLSSAERAALAPAVSIDPAALVRVRPKAGLYRGAAVSVGDGGFWLTAQDALAGCARPAVMVSDTDGLAARAGPGAGGAVVLTTARGAPALPLVLAEPKPGSLAFVGGYPRGRSGELALRLLGPETLARRDRSRRSLPVLAWAEIGRTDGLAGSLGGGLVGAPALDGEGRIVGVALAEAPRRGRLYTTTPAALGEALARAKAPWPPAQAAGAAFTVQNYGLAADDLRRALRIAPVACLRG